MIKVANMTPFAEWGLFSQVNIKKINKFGITERLTSFDKAPIFWKSTRKDPRLSWYLTAQITINVITGRRIPGTSPEITELNLFALFIFNA
jgi:hypothetical protein